MKKIFSVIISAMFLLTIIAGCSGKSYELSSKPAIVLKTSSGDLKIQLYKKAAPKSAELFVKFCKEKKYKDTLIDEVLIPAFTINFGFKTVDTKIEPAKEGLNKEVIAKDKKIEKNDLLFRADNEGFGMVSIYFAPSAIDTDEPIVVFGKVVDSDATIEKIKETRVDGQYKPVDAIKILDVEVTE